MSNYNAFMKTEASTTSALMLEYQQFNSEDFFSTGSFDIVEDFDITPAEEQELLAIFNAHSDETSVEMPSLQRCLSLTSSDEEDTASVSGIPELLTITEELQVKHDLEIPPEAKITSIPLSSFPPKMQQLMSARAKNVSEVRQATETAICVWPVIKVNEASRPFWDYFQKSIIPTSLNLTRHCSSPDVVIEDVKCSQEELYGKTARSYPLIVKSSNSVVSQILKSLTNIKNKDDENMLSLSPIGPVGEQLEIPLSKSNAVVIYNGQVYLLYVTRHEALSSDMEIYGPDMLLRTSTVWLITCNAVRDIMTEVAHPPLSRDYVVEENVECLVTLDTPPRQGKTSNATDVSPFTVTTVSQPTQCFPSTGKKQQFLNETVFPSKEGLQKRNEEAARWEKDNELRKKFGIVKDVRVLLNRISLPELTDCSGKASALQSKVSTRTKKQEKVLKWISDRVNGLPQLQEEYHMIHTEKRPW